MKGYIEGNVLVDGNVIDTAFFLAHDKEEMEEWIKDHKILAKSHPFRMVVEIYLLQHDHALNIKVASGKEISHCDCGIKGIQKPYWSSVEVNHG